MKTYRIRFAERAVEDLIALHLRVEGESGIERADAYQARIETYCAKLQTFPERGTPRDELARSLRSLSFERSISILYRVTGDEGVIVRAVSSARDLDALALD